MCIALLFFINTLTFNFNLLILSLFQAVFLYLGLTSTYHLCFDSVEKVKFVSDEVRIGRCEVLPSCEDVCTGVERSEQILECIKELGWLTSTPQ